MNLVILFTVLLELVNTLEAQNFKCPQDKPGGACGKGKDSKGNFRKVTNAPGDPNLNFSCKPTKNEAEARFCCPMNVLVPPDQLAKLCQRM
ncbi:hypothetical protein PCANC_13008 [Puccinia coronata f. sp. avenae]|uniref:Hydrophobin n=1 Tax=Puccinia coronata f. sp. avenae TaxID=200324 RepID=A0A2N5SSU3_9BASI|nr:hypothetical protein PCANC_13008 [Puccinia coronata f. sp. avenae]PLW49493.1 hypothetical protein PCASD_01924 [Puccinia coronata f. sp. avenae]